MTSTTQSIARFSILCYLTVASIAAAHAFPTLGTLSSEGNSRAVMAMHMPVGKNQAQASMSEASATMADMQSDCHQSESVSSDANSVSQCKIVCSATGHAVTSDIFIGTAFNSPQHRATALSDNLRSRLLVVEQRPPK